MLGIFKQFVYIKLARDLLTVRDPKNKNSVSERPDIAIRDGKKKIVVAVGNAARASAAGSDVTVTNPFAHPRSLLSDFTLAELVIREFIRRLRPNALIRMGPVVVMHPQGEFEGGLTQIELRALRELALGAGASEVVLWQGPTLTDEQVMSREFPRNGAVLPG